MVSARRPTIETDVFVVGGGPAGLAAALAARQNGFSVALADRARPPIDKACGEGLMPDGLAALRALGIELGPDHGRPFRGIRFVDAEVVAEACFPRDHGLGIRRTLLHRLLRERAEEAGVATHWGAPIDAGDPAELKIGDRTVDCRWVIGADGAQSRLRDWATLPPVWNGLRRIGMRQHFRLRPWTDFVEVYWRNGIQAYVTPVASDEVCVALLGNAPGARLSELPALFPGLAKRLGGAERSGPARGAMSMSTTLRRVTRGPVALVGDASGAVDAVTGEGVSLAFRQAIALGAALAAGDLALYETAHRRMRRIPLLMARLLLLMSGNDGLRRRVLRALATQPRVFNQLLAGHVGQRHPAALTFGIGSFALQLLASSSSRATIGP